MAGLREPGVGLRVSRLPSALDVPTGHQPDENGNHEGPHGRCAVVRAVGSQSKHVEADTPVGWPQPIRVIRPSAECVSKVPDVHARRPKSGRSEGVCR